MSIWSLHAMDVRSQQTYPCPYFDIIELEITVHDHRLGPIKRRQLQQTACRGQTDVWVSAQSMFRKMSWMEQASKDACFVQAHAMHTLPAKESRLTQSSSRHRKE